MSTFKTFAKKVNESFEKITKSSQVFRVKMEKDELWDLYLSSFTPEENPIFRQRTDHDCNCCKNFIRNLGTLVSINDDLTLSTVWDDVEGLDTTYSRITKILSEHVKSKGIESIYVSKFSKYGAEKTWDNYDHEKTWNHFFGVLPNFLVSNSVDRLVGSWKTNNDVLLRSLESLTLDSLTTVQELITSNSIYRGESYLTQVNAFIEAKKTYDSLDNSKKSVFVASISHKSLLYGFKNSAIGTLVENISTGMDVETAVRQYESIVAPQNYRRTNTIVTPKMIESALSVIRDLGLEEALNRRPAKSDDIKIENILWKSQPISNLDKDPLKDLLMSSAKKNVKNPNISKNPATGKISMEDFILNILPKCSKVEINLDSDHINNFFTLLTSDSDKKLFKWSNPFSWTYNGGYTDSIQEKVKKAGGSVQGDLRVSLEWFNYDDLDLSCIQPDRDKIYYGNRKGVLDVDANAGHGYTRTPVENLNWSNPKNGRYEVWVHSFSKRENKDVGFNIQIADKFSCNTYTYEKTVTNNQRIKVFEFSYLNGEIKGLSVCPALKDKATQKVSQDVWGLKTNSLVEVDKVLLSPNCWGDNPIGNKHFMFVLKDCKNPDKEVRSIYNEYLSDELLAHRKTLDLLGNKLKCEMTEEQLSGLGFSSTKKQEIEFFVTTSEGKKTIHVTI